MKNVGKLESCKLNLMNLYSCYDYSGYSLQELLCQFFEAIKECIENSNEMKELAQWLVSTGLSQEVNKKINELIADGTLEAMVGEGLLNAISDVEKRVDKIEKKMYVTPHDFGAVGDGSTDDTLSIQKAIDYCFNNNLSLKLLDRKYYVTNTIKTKGVHISSLSGIAGNCDPLFLRKQDGSYVYGSPNWNYFYNQESDFTWRRLIDEVAYGCCIVSDKPIIILSTENGVPFSLSNFAIVGYHNAKGQIGISDSTPVVYKGNSHDFNGIKVLGCGSHGIRLMAGFEVSVTKKIECSYNIGHGLYTGYTEGVDSATEYLRFENCRFNSNKLDGVHFKYWRKQISFINCMFNNNGQYHAYNLQDSINGSRAVPVNIKDCRAGIFFENGNLEDGRLTNLGFNLINCFGEECIKGVHLDVPTGFGILNNVRIKNNIFYRGHVPKPSTTGKGCCFYLNYGYLSSFDSIGNYGNDLDVYILAQQPNDGGEVNITEHSFTRTFRNSVNLEKELYSKGRIKTESNVLFRSFNGSTSDAIKQDFTKKIGNDESNYVAMYLLTGASQTGSSDTFGGYLLGVTRLPSGNYSMISTSLHGVNGFSNAPVISADGTLTLNLKQYHRATLTRIDLTKTN